MPRISPSIASCHLLKMGEEIRKVESLYEDLHIDIEDGNFTPNITFGLKTVKAIREMTDLPFSAHLMVTSPMEYIEPLSSLNCSIIFVHGESSMYLKRIFYEIHKRGIKAGLALNPCSNIQDYEVVYDDIDAVLYMTSEVDGRGERFQERVLQKMKPVPHKEIWVDGGVNQDNLYCLPDYVSTVVMGRSVFQ